MSLDKIKSSLDQLIADKNNSVLALSGKWGTGKTHLWEEARNRSQDKQTSGALYVSLFGVRDIAQLKVKMLQATLPDSQPGRFARDAALMTLKGATKVLKSFNGGFAALEDLAQLTLPQLLRNRFIVIDDIERKHAALSVDDLMGFISELTQSHNSRLLLILNSDKLGDRESWEQFRDKVIDHELCLSLEPVEAFDIAATILPSPFEARIRSAIDICGVSNIRIIVKIIRVVNTLLADRSDLPDQALNRVVPSAVLLSALHYKGMENAPTIDYVMSYNSLLEHVEEQKIAEAEDDNPEFAEKLISGSWASLLDKLLIAPCEDFESVVAQYLRTGLLDKVELNEALDSYIDEIENGEANGRARKFFWNARWNMEMDESDLLREAEALLIDAALFSPSMATALHKRISTFARGAELANKLVRVWVEAFETDGLEAHYGDYTEKPLHPDIEAALLRRDERLRPPPLTLLAACRSMDDSDKYEDAIVAAFGAATMENYLDHLEGLSGADLELFMGRHFELYRRRKFLEKKFDKALELFGAACKRIRDTAPEQRRAKLIETLFAEAKLSTVLHSES